MFLSVLFLAKPELNILIAGMPLLQQVINSALIGAIFLENTMHIHFVGFRTDSEYWSAVRVFGQPDFIHMWHDSRMYGDIGPTDKVIFGSKGKETISEYSWQDHEIW